MRSMSSMRFSGEEPCRRVRIPFCRLISRLRSLAEVSRNHRETAELPSTIAAAFSQRTWQWMSIVNHLPRAWTGPGKRPACGSAPGGRHLNSIRSLLLRFNRSDRRGRRTARLHHTDKTWGTKLHARCRPPRREGYHQERIIRRRREDKASRCGRTGCTVQSRERIADNAIVVEGTLRRERGLNQIGERYHRGLRKRAGKG